MMMRAVPAVALEEAVDNMLAVRKLAVLGNHGRQLRALLRLQHERRDRSCQKLSAGDFHICPGNRTIILRRQLAWIVRGRTAAHRASAHPRLVDRPPERKNQEANDV